MWRIHSPKNPNYTSKVHYSSHSNASKKILNIQFAWKLFREKSKSNSSSGKMIICSSAWHVLSIGASFWTSVSAPLLSLRRTRYRLAEHRGCSRSPDLDTERISQSLTLAATISSEVHVAVSRPREPNSRRMFVGLSRRSHLAPRPIAASLRVHVQLIHAEIPHRVRTVRVRFHQMEASPLLVHLVAGQNGRIPRRAET